MSSRQSGATRDLSHKVDFSPFGRRPLVRDDRFAGATAILLLLLFNVNINSSNREFVIPTERSDEESQNIVRKEISHIR